MINGCAKFSTPSDPSSGFIAANIPLPPILHKASVAKGMVSLALVSDHNSTSVVFSLSPYLHHWHTLNDGTVRVQRQPTELTLSIQSFWKAPYAQACFVPLDIFSSHISFQSSAGSDFHLRLKSIDLVDNVVQDFWTDSQRLCYAPLLCCHSLDSGTSWSSTRYTCEKRASPYYTRNSNST